MNILDCARNLLAGLSSQRTGVDSRPLIFIGHSLGGLVIKKALLEAKEREDPIWNATREGGIMFMGVPHAGSGLTGFAQTLANIANLYTPTNTSMLKQLAVDSPELLDLSRRFGNIQKYLQLVSVLEAERTPMPKLGRGSAKVVEDNSARLNLGEEEYKIDGSDHSTICKFDDAKNPEYLKVESSLKKLVGQIRASTRM